MSALGDVVDRLTEGPPRTVVAFLCAVLVVAAGLADQATAREIGMELLYLAPVALAGWYLDRTWALGYAVLCTGLWLLLESLDRPSLWEPLVSLWNGITRLGLFLLVAWALWALREATRRGKALMRVDDASGARNAAAFYEATRLEMDRSRRTGAPFTVAFFDVEGWADIVRSGGLSASERLLRTVANAIGEVIRSTDVLARLHEDRFAVMFPSTGRVEAGAVLLKISDRATRGMRQADHSTGLTMAAATFTTPPESANELRRVLEDGLRVAREDDSTVVHHVMVGSRS